VSNRTTQSALIMAGAAAGLAAASWLKRRRLVDVSAGPEELVEPERAELPIGRSADPNIDDTLSRRLLPQDETSGAALLSHAEPFEAEGTTDASLDEVWNSLPGLAEAEQSEGYDAVSPEDLGSVWLERATQTTHEARPHGSDPTDMPDIENLMISEATLASSQMAGDDFDEEGSVEDEEVSLEDEAIVRRKDQDKAADEAERIADDELG
jgi:hypothetical protein